MNTIDQLQDVMADEMDLQSKYNQHLLNITNPEVRQLFTQFRETKMQHVTELQQQIKNLMQTGSKS
jgi:rubrerythrin